MRQNLIFKLSRFLVFSSLLVEGVSSFRSFATHTLRFRLALSFVTVVALAAASTAFLSFRDSCLRALRSLDDQDSPFALIGKRTQLVRILHQLVFKTLRCSILRYESQISPNTSMIS